MKAEHRKELQTNALADRMGRFIKRAKKGPSRGLVLTVVLGLVCLFALGFFLWRRSSATAREAALWTDFELGPMTKGVNSNSRPVSYYDYLRSQHPESLQARGVQIQLAWVILYDEGIKSLLADPFGSLQRIKAAKKLYQNLLPEVKSDPVLGPEVRYQIAVAEEALAIEDAASHLKEAARLYQAVADDFPDSAHAKQAKERAKQLKDPVQGRRIEEFYFVLRLQTQGQMFPGGQMPNLQDFLKKHPQFK